MASEELKPLPCPFCLGLDLVASEDDWGWPIIYCRRCEASGPPDKESGDYLHESRINGGPGRFAGAWKLWNGRASASAIAAEAVAPGSSPDGR